MRFGDWLTTVWTRWRAYKYFKETFVNVGKQNVGIPANSTSLTILRSISLVRFFRIRTETILARALLFSNTTRHGILAIELRLSRAVCMIHLIKARGSSRSGPT